MTSFLIIEPTSAFAYGLNLLYGIAWLCLLVHCLRKKAFFPVCGRGRATKVFWLVTFAFFNPVLTFFYLVFGVLAPGRARPTGLRSALVIGLVLLTIGLFHVPVALPGAEVRLLAGRARVAPQESETAPSGWNFYLGRIISSARNNTSLAQWSPNSAAFAGRTILILNRSEDPLMGRVGYAVQDRLAGLSGVESVACYPAGRVPDPGERFPDLVVTLDLVEKTEVALPLSRTLTARIRYAAGCTAFPGPGFHDAVRPPTAVQFKLAAEIGFESQNLALESPGGRYQAEAERIAKDIGKSLADNFQSLGQTHGRVPALPDSLYGPFHPAPDLGGLGLSDLEPVLSGPALLKHNRAVWRFTNSRDTETVLRNLKTALVGKGWEPVSTTTDTFLFLKNGRRTLNIHRRQPPKSRMDPFAPRRRESARAPEPFIIHHHEHMSREAVAAALEDVLEADLPLVGLVMFGKLFEKTQADRFRARLDAFRPKTPAGYLKLAEVRFDRNEREKAADSLRRAAVLARASDGPGLDAGKAGSLARKLGDEKLAHARPDLATCRALGFLEQDPESPVIEAETGPDAPLHVFGPCGGEGRIFTLMVRVVRRANGDLMVRYKAEERLHENAWGGASGSTKASASPVSVHLQHTTALIRVDPLEGNRTRVRIRFKSRT